ncbi:MAG: protein kinase [Phycisphaerae bacterium]|nr:protein kinase [Phycisphaerae bacterium]
MMVYEGSVPGRHSAEGDASAKGDALQHVVEQYLEELAAGRTPDQERYLREHPALADTLRGVFKTLEFVEATGRTLGTSQLERGRLLGEFRILREVARGGMGVVYEAVQTSLNRRVALKVLPAGAMLAGHAADRFRREASLAGGLHHTNIVPVYAVGETEGICYYAMQFIEGASLAKHLRELRRTGTRPGRDYHQRVARWGRQVAEALAYAHEQSVIHRDIKPSNLLLDARDNVWIADFGLARVDAMSTFTLSGDVVGTARYMSPEQARGGRTRIDVRTDIYSLGVTMYELLALQPAFEGSSRAEVLNRVVFADPPSLRRVDPAMPRDLETIVAKCMEKEAQRRYAQAGDVAEDLRRFLADEPIRARRTPHIVRVVRFVRRRRWLSGATALVVVLALTTILLGLKIRAIRGQRCLEQAGEAILLENDFQRGARLVEEARSWGVDSAELHLYRGLIPLLNNQPHRAIGPLTEALQRVPDNLEAGYALALAHVSAGDIFNGERIAERLAGRENTTALGWLLRGLSLGKLQRSGAIEAYDRAIALRPDFTPAIEARAHYRGIRLIVEGRRSELEPMLNDTDALVIFRPTSSRARAARAAGWLFAAAYATTQADLRQFRESWLANCENDLGQALAMRHEDDSFALGQQGTYSRYVGDFRGAAEAFAQALAVDRTSARDSDPALVHEYAMMLYGLGDLQSALDAIEPLCGPTATYYSLLLQRALLLAELGRLTEARDACREFMTRYRTNASALFLSVAMMELLGDSNAAAAGIGEFVARRPEESTSEDAEQATPRLAVGFLTRQLSASALLAAAQDDPGRRCEFAFLIGLRKLGEGDRVGGLASLQACMDTQAFRFGEYRFAQAILARAQADPHWPRWLSAQHPPPASRADNP